MKKLFMSALLMVSVTSLLYGMNNKRSLEIDDQHKITKTNVYKPVDNVSDLIHSLKLSITNRLIDSSRNHGKSDFTIFKNFYYNGYRKWNIQWDDTPLKKLDDDFNNLIALEKINSNASAIAANNYNFEENLRQVINGEGWEEWGGTADILYRIREFLDNYDRYK